MLKILLLPLVFCLSWPMHPFYLSVCDLKYDDKEKSIQGTAKIFTGDLEEALFKINHKQVDLINTKDDLSTKSILTSYLQSHLLVYVNEKQLEIGVLGYENEEEAVWVYIELKNCPRPKNILIDNKILCEYLPQQMNIVHFQVDKVQKSAKASCEDTRLQFGF